MSLVRSLLFNLLFYPGTLLFVLAGLAIFPVGEHPMQVVVHGWARFHQLLTRHLLGIEDRFEGTWPRGQALIVVKHQSMYEAVATLRLFDTPVVVMKNQLSDMPLFGWLTRRYGVIGVDREAGSAALRNLVSAGKAAAASGRPVVIFPEGTRVPVGQQPELKPGFAALYRATGLPVVPIAMDAGKVWPKGLVKRTGVVTFRVGETIPPGLSRAEIEARVHEAINALERQPAS
ncbi:MAG: 1-acyl-sn-glycerol-3-phosphate acyltransferase [Pseudomonadota bacterium]|nr:1-acyl-sn-glycerol-3-phosphate acyltransferase [Pseudomonadota bacterium]